MCGIVASLGMAPPTELYSLPHRGPDQEFYGQFEDLRVVFNRLTITGGQFGTAPVTSADGRWTCFLNGEIYNFKELISKFNLKPSPSDTAVLVEGLQKTGLQFLNYLAGMFAILIVDHTTSSFFVARDPLGEKPLFYSITNEGILIASEFRSLLNHIGGGVMLNESSLHDYFRFGYIEGPKTLDQRIEEFPRGELVEISPSRIKTIQAIPENMEYDFLRADLKELVAHIRSQVMRTEVKYALLLSGGFDSSSLLSEVKDSEGYAFTLNSGKKVNKGEVKRASGLAGKAGLDHILVDIQDRGLLEDLQSVAKSLDQPHADMASIGYYRLFQTIQSKGVKVAVSGIGLDELFWGYSWFNRHLKKLSDGFDRRIFWDTPATLNKLLELIPSSIPNTNNLSADLYLKSKSKYQRARAEMVHSYLSINGLSQIDRLSMQFSVEARSPYADYRLYLWAQQNANTHRDFEKSTIKKALLPTFSIQRLFKKKGFDLGMMEYMNEVKALLKVSEVIHSLDERHLLPFKIPKAYDLNTRERYRFLMLEYWLRAFD